MNNKKIIWNDFCKIQKLISQELINFIASEDKQEYFPVELKNIIGELYKSFIENNYAKEKSWFKGEVNLFSNLETLKIRIDIFNNFVIEYTINLPPLNLEEIKVDMLLNFSDNEFVIDCNTGKILNTNNTTKKFLLNILKIRW